MGATVSHRPSLVMYFQVSVVDQVLVFEPREPPVRRDRSRLRTLGILYKREALLKIIGHFSLIYNVDGFQRAA